MDATLLADLHERLTDEGARDAAPDGFPELPDIPLGRYTDPDLYKAEIDQVFRKSWLFVGHQCEYPENGSYRLLDLPFAPVVVVRGRDGALRGFYNSCRHRGAPVVREESGTTKRLVCQFHSWSYDLEGRLGRVPCESQFVGLKPEARSLRPVRIETWGNYVFANLDDDAEPLLDWIEPLVSRFSDMANAPMRLIDKKSYELPVNWKIVAEAFLETYHVNTVHPEGKLAVDTKQTVTMLYPNGHSYQAVAWGPLVQEAMFAQMMWPVDLATPDQLKAYTGIQSGMYSFPNVQILPDRSGGPVFGIWPLGVDKTRFDVTLYGTPWEGDERPAGWDMKVAQIDMLVAQDMANLEPIQRSLESAAHSGIPLGSMERGLWHLHASLDRALGPDLVPEALRVPDLLADYVEHTTPTAARGA